MEEDEKADKTFPDRVEPEYLGHLIIIAVDICTNLDTEQYWQHMRTLAGSGAQIHFTHLSSSSSNALSSVFADNYAPSLANATSHQVGVLELIRKENVQLDKICLLDPKDENELRPERRGKHLRLVSFWRVSFPLVTSGDMTAVY